MARELSIKSGHRAGLAVPRAAAIIYALMSQETLGLLVGERGWPASDWRAWVEAGLRAQLLAP